MKRVIFALGVLLCIQSYGQQIVYKYTSTDFNVVIPNLKSGQYGLAGAVMNNISGAVMYKVNGIEHIIQNTADSLSPAIHFIKDNITGKWVFENYYPEASVTGGFRNYVFVDTLGTIAFASTGSEAMQPWPHGDMLLCRTQGTKLVWTRISNEKSFYHSIGMGDLNGDGLLDAVGVHMGTRSNWYEGPHIYTQNADISFSQTRNFLDVSQYKGLNNGLGSTYVGNLLGNKYPEIVLAEYGFNPSFNVMSNRQGFGIFTYDNALKKYKYLSSPSKLGAFSDSTHGATSIKSADFNKDGNTDMAIATEGYPAPRIQIWLGNGKGDFSPSQILSYQDTALPFPQSVMDFREFEIMDFDNDGWQDIVVHPYNIGYEFRINPGPMDNNTNPYGWKGSGIKLQNSIWKNNKGVFDKIKNNIILSNIRPDFMKGFMIDNNIRFFGFEMNAGNPPNFNLFKLYDVSVHFCNNLIKPTFSNSKFSFCSGDSLKIAVSNINKGDSLKWYYGTKSDITNVSNKTFTDSTKLFVTRTDSLGCIISSDTIQIKKYGIPSAPSITRDTANFLLSGAMGTTWYKDGSVITDTTQKYKPTAAGSYTAKTTTNGCTSVMSAAYYYLVTDIINLSKDEFIKLAPNPFINQLNFDFVVKGYQKLNIEVYDVATGSKVATQQNITAGTQIQLGQLARGTYIIRVTSNDNKIAQQFKMVKL